MVVPSQSHTMQTILVQRPLIFTATDDTETGFSSSDTATYSVVAYDNVPLLFNVPDQTIALGAAFDTLDLSAYLTELDGDNVIWDYEFLDYPSNVPTPDWEAPISGTFTMGVVSTVEALGVTRSRLGSYSDCCG